MVAMARLSWGALVLLSIISALTSCNTESTVANTGKVVEDKREAVNEENQTIVADPLNLPVVAKLEGQYLKAFLAAYSGFKDDASVPEAKREIKNYSIELRQLGKNYLVLFLAKRKPTERNLLGGESELGKDVMYTIDGDNFRILEKKFYK